MVVDAYLLFDTSWFRHLPPACFLSKQIPMLMAVLCLESNVAVANPWIVLNPPHCKDDSRIFRNRVISDRTRKETV